jgi:DNA-binding NtrC family response regulator
MGDHLFALVVHGDDEPFVSLKRTLWELSIETYSVETCEEAGQLIAQCKPHVIFTGAALQDGSWLSILNMAEAVDVPLNVIVVGSTPNMRNYVSVMERGAFDFLAPPFEHEPLDFVVRSAHLDACRRREAAARIPVA